MLKDKAIKDQINSLSLKLRKKTASSRKDGQFVAPRFIFVCGKDIHTSGDTIRKITIEKLEQQKTENMYGFRSNNVLCVISENLYNQDLAEDLFSFEKMLAEISHKIIIVTESAGTYCELGAFVMDDECRKKTVVINEDKEEFANSFITKGPIKMLESDNEKAVILHNGIDHIKSNSEYEFRMEEVAKEALIITPNLECQCINLRSLIYELTNIVELFQPIEAFEIERIYLTIKGFKNYTIKKSKHKIRTISNVIKLMEKMGLVIKAEGLYTVFPKISCYDVMFNISRKEYNDFRIRYLNRMSKIHPERMLYCNAER